MEKLEKKIEDAGLNYLAEYIDTPNIKQAFIIGAKSPEAKEYHLFNSRNELRMLFNLGIDFARHYKKQSFDIDSQKREFGFKNALKEISQMISFNKKIKSPEAKELWQQGMYSQDDVEQLIVDYDLYLDKCRENEQHPISARDWFKQNKKK